MKTMKKITMMLLAICLIIPVFSTVSLAANKIMFEDPTTAVGEILELKGVIEADNEIEDRTIVMTYDSSMLKFQSGDNVTESGTGKITYNATGKAGGNRVEFIMKFEVLKEGTTEVQVESYTIYSTTDARLTCEKGHSVIQIAEGETPAVTTDTPTDVSGTSVEVNGETYTFSEEFEEADIPEGFAEATLDYAGTSYKVVMESDTGMYLAYLVNAAGEGNFFLYVEESATFAPFARIEISDTTEITVLNDIEGIYFPESYVEEKAEINGFTFPAWHSKDNDEIWVLYAMNNRGESLLYQYDSVEGTYQRFEMPALEEETKEETLLDKLNTVFGESMSAVIIGVAVLVVFFLLLIIVLSVKLYNRNAELDELYDEYGIDLFEEESLEKKDNGVIQLDEEDEFEDIEDEIEEDIVIADLEEIENDSEEDSEEEDSEEEDSEIEVEFYEQKETEEPEELEEIKEVQEESLEEAMKELAAEVRADEEYWDDEDDDDFEMDFIDLDD